MARTIRYERLPTEKCHPRSRALDRLSTSQLLQLMAKEDSRVVRAVSRQRTQVARAISLISKQLCRGGKLFFLGAGTSGRLGVIEAAECPPTFHTPPSMVQAIIAGGKRAVFRSKEGAEDNRSDARLAIRRKVCCDDVVVGIAASGVTPFASEGLLAARSRGAKTILITCNPHSRNIAEIRISPNVGPEVLTGSTRLKAGTATKLILNMLTLGTMIQLGKTYGNLMVDVRPTSRKLRARAIRIIQSFTRVSEHKAKEQLRAARGNVKVAIVMARQKLTYATARRRLAAAKGSLRQALF